MTDQASKPVLLAADSQLLFWRDQTGFVLRRLARDLNVDNRSACYIGAANGDRPEYYELFQGAMEILNIQQCRFIRTGFTGTDREALKHASVVVLSGGDPVAGWHTLKSLRPELEEAREQGAFFIGVSAGAMHLAALAWPEKAHLLASDLFATLGWVPCLVGAHEEASEWQALKQAMHLSAGCFQGIGLPFGSGVLAESSGEIKALRYSVACFEWNDREVKESWLAPAL